MALLPMHLLLCFPPLSLSFLFSCTFSLSLYRLFFFYTKHILLSPSISSFANTIRY
ncbi:hypothetical protein AtEden1_Chr5g0145051 [Arabidopsis thaliana]